MRAFVGFRVIVTGALALAFLGVADTRDVEPLSSIIVPTQLIDQFASRYEVVRRTDAGFEIYVPSGEREALLQTNPTLTLLREDIDADFRSKVQEDPTYLNGYRTFDEVSDTLEMLAATYPEIVSLSQYGTSTNGYPLYALKISDNVNVDEEEPEVMLTAATHGDELITVEVLLRLVEKLLAGYGTDERFSAIVDSTELYVIPVVNPDGFTRRSRYANGVDPNRDYPWPETPDRSPETCVQAIMDFFHSRNIVWSLDLHASGQMVMYPWAYTSRATDDEDANAFQSLGEAMARDNGYEVGQISRIIYVAKGSSADYYFWQSGSLSYGIELATTKVPPSSRIDGVVNEAEEMTWTFVEYFFER